MTTLRWAALAAAFSAGLFAQEAGEPGMKLAEFALQDLGGKTVSFGTAGQITTVIFTSVQCPVSNAYNERMQALYKDYSGRGVHFVFVNANASESPSAVGQHAREHGFTFPVFKDENNQLADRLNAQVTPETYVFDKQGVLVYHGPIDDAQHPARISRRPLHDALDAVLAGKPVSVSESKAFGCSIKRVRKAS
jgi:peroxiredoxin